MILTRSLSTAAGGLSTPKSSSDTSGDAWPWQRADSRPSSSIPRSIPELSMVLAPQEEEDGGGPGGSGGGQEDRRRTGGARGRSGSAGEPLGAPPLFIGTRRAPPATDTTRLPCGRGQQNLWLLISIGIIEMKIKVAWCSNFNPKDLLWKTASRQGNLWLPEVHF